VIDAGAGSDTVTAAAGNDVLIYVAAENTRSIVSSVDLYDGGTGVDTLRLVFTRAEWMSKAVQADVANYLAFLAANTDSSGEANAATFTFSTFELTTVRIEKLAVTVDGVAIDPANHPVTLGDDAISTPEDVASAALDVLANDAVPDLVKSLSHTEPLHGSVQWLADHATGAPVAAVAGGAATVSAPASNFIYTPDAGYYDYLAAGESATDSFTYTVTDASGDVKTATVSVTITGTNDAPAITSFAQAAMVSEGNAMPAPAMVGSGTITYGDVDLSDGHTLSIGVAAAYGSATVDTLGAWTYTMHDAGAVNALAAGEHLADSFSVLVEDGHGGSASELVIIDIVGTNDAPVITSAAQAGAAKEDSTLTATGRVSSSDVDHNATATYSGNAAGAYGSFEVNASSGEWIYTLDNASHQNLAQGESHSESFTVTVTDDQGATVTQAVVLNITGTNDAPVITSAAQAGAVQEDSTLTATGRVSASDVDHNATATYSGNAAGAYGSFAVNASSGEWIYTLDNANHQNLAQGESHSESFTVTVTDDQGASTLQAVLITITGINDVPTITTALTDAIGAVTEDAATPALSNSGAIAFNDIDLVDAHSATVAAFAGNTLGGTLTMGAVAESAITAAGAVGWTYNVANSATQFLGAGQSATEKFNVTVSDGHGGTMAQVVEVGVTGTNDAPTITQQDLAGAVRAATENDVPAASPFVFTVQQYLGFQVNNLATLRSYVASHTADYTVQTNVIDFTDDPSGFAGDIPGSSPWPAAAARGVTSTAGINNNFFARITANFSVTTADTYTFRTYNDDGVFLLIDNILVISDSGYHPEAPFSGSIALAPGNHSIELFFYENGGEASLEFSARSSTGPFGLVGASGGGLGTAIAQLTDSGTIRFADLDLTDAHLVSAIGTPVGSVLGSLSAVKTADTTGSGTGGQLSWTYTADNAALKYLAAGETKVDSFTITLDDQHGGLITKQIDVTLTGTNNAPVVAATDVTGAVTELTTAPGAATLTDSGTIAFTDVDLIDIHSVGAVTPGAGALGVLTASVSTDTAGGLGGVVTWQYSVADAAVEYLAAGQTRVDTFSFDLLDGHGGSVARSVNVTITGTNDAPVVAATDVSGAVTELTTAPGAAILTDSGTIAFTDVDLIDIHSVSAVTPVAGALGTLTASMSTDTSHTSGLGGVVTWQYSVADAAVEYLAAGQTKVETFSFDLLDGHGGSVARSVNVTITGTNDAPVARADTGATNEDTALTLAAASLLANDTDDAGPITVIAVSGMSTRGASVTLNAHGDVVYNPTGSASLQALTRGQQASDTFSYTVADSAGATSTTTVAIMVDGRLEVPVANPDAFTLVQGSVHTGNVVSNDIVNGSIVSSGNVLTNGSFEDGHPVSSGGISYPASLPGWTSVQGSFEVWGTGFGGNIASDGIAFLELDNGFGRDAYSSSLTTDPGRNYALKFDLALRNGTAPASNQVEFLVNGVSLGIFTPPSPTFSTFSVNFIGSGTDVIMFKEPASANDSLGGLIDNLRIAASADVFVTAVNGIPGAVGTAITGSHGGVFRIASNGAYSFDTGSAFAYLAANESVTSTMAYTVTDDGGSATAMVSATVTGTNKAPVAVADSGVSITEDGTVNVTFSPIGNATASGVANEYIITNDATSKVGALWSNSKVSLNTSFSIGAELFFGTNDAGADGFTFIIQNNSKTAIGAAGQGLGYQNIGNSVSIEFDTYNNFGNDIANDHIAFNTGGLMNAIGGVTDLGNIEDGLYHAVQVGWNAASHVLTLNYEGTNVVVSRIIDVAALVGGNEAYIGFAGSTGGASNLQKIRNLNYQSADNTVVLDVLLNDTDADPGDKATLKVVAATSDHGATLAFSGVAGSGITYAPGHAFDYLAAGSTAIDTVTYVIKDVQGAKATGTAQVIVNGLNDAPVVATTDVTGAVTGLKTTGTLKLVDSGTIAFSDADLVDTHSVSAVTPVAGALGTLTASVSSDTSQSTGGIVTWNYSVADTQLASLAAGASKVDTFSFNVLDNHGGSVARTISVTATGAYILHGNADANTRIGSALADAISGLGGNDMLTGGSGADTFIFGMGAGNDTITNFTIAGAGADHIVLSGIAAMTTFAQAMAATTQVGANAVIALSANDSITLIGVSADHLVASSFLFA